MTDTQSSSDADELRQLAEAVGTISGRCSLEGDRTALIIAGTQLRQFAKYLDSAQQRPEPVAYTNAAQLSFLQDPSCAGIPMAMWAKPNGSERIPLYASPPAALPAGKISEAVFAKCAEIANRYNDCGGDFIAQKIRDEAYALPSTEGK